MNNELLPCPLCGSTEVEARGYADADGTFVQCRNCGVSVDVLSDMSPWNSRGKPVAFIRESDLDCLSKPGIAGCAASLEKEPRAGFVAIFTAQVDLTAPTAQYQGKPVVWLDPQSGRKANTISHALKLHNEAVGGAPASASALYTMPLFRAASEPAAAIAHYLAEVKSRLKPKEVCHACRGSDAPCDQVDCETTPCKVGRDFHRPPVEELIEHIESLLSGIEKARVPE